MEQLPTCFVQHHCKAMQHPYHGKGKGGSLKTSYHSQIGANSSSGSSTFGPSAEKVAADDVV